MKAQAEELNKIRAQKIEVMKAEARKRILEQDKWTNRFTWIFAMKIKFDEVWTKTIYFNSYFKHCTIPMSKQITSCSDFIIYNLPRSGCIFRRTLTPRLK